MSNLTHTYNGLNPGLTTLEKTAVGLGVNANAIDYAPTLLAVAEDVPIPPTFDEGQTDVPAVVPDMTWLKADIEAWLADHGVAYPAGATKAELLALAWASVEG